MNMNKLTKILISISLLMFILIILNEVYYFINNVGEYEGIITEYHGYTGNTAYFIINVSTINSTVVIFLSMFIKENSTLPKVIIIVLSLIFIVFINCINVWYIVR